MMQEFADAGIQLLHHRNAIRVLVEGYTDRGAPGGDLPPIRDLLQHIGDDPTARQLFQEMYGMPPYEALFSWLGGGFIADVSPATGTRETGVMCCCC